MSVSCKMCGAEAPDDAVFCEECGQKLESPAADAVPTVACPACGTANPPDSAFCEECGAEYRMTPKREAESPASWRRPRRRELAAQPWEAPARE